MIACEHGACDCPGYPGQSVQSNGKPQWFAHVCVGIVFQHAYLWEPSIPLQIHYELAVVVDYRS